MVERCIKYLRVAVLAGATLFALPAVANYPLSGKWTYDDVAGKGPAPKCGPRVMEFSGVRRSDTEGGVHDYRNITAYANGANRWRLTDEFFNGQIRGRVIYTLRRTDDDHIEIRIESGGEVFKLRRCA